MFNYMKTLKLYYYRLSFIISSIRIEFFCMSGANKNERTNIVDSTIVTLHIA